MSERRMFAKTIIDSDAFLEMSATAQLLYFHLSMRADDDGFVNNPKTIIRMCSCSNDDLECLVEKKFVIPFESGIVVIKHWKINNYIRNDRYIETKYKEERAMLELDKNKAYTTQKKPLDTIGIPSDNQMDTQYSIGKDSIDKDSIDFFYKDYTNNKYGEFENVSLSESDIKKLQEKFPDDYLERIEKLSAYIDSTGKEYKNHYATIVLWSKNEAKEEDLPIYPEEGYGITV